jgi:uncharacterized protein (DUF488 family)
MVTPKPEVEIWTIGHSTHPLEKFLDLLQAHSVTALADVRRFPGSRRHPQFNQEALSDSLSKAGITYVHFPELGGRRPTSRNSPNTAWRNAAFRGYADYMATREFRNGIARVLRLAENHRVCLMCAETLWWQCHRGLVADCLKAKGHQVWHILGTGKLQEHPFTSAARVVDGQLSYAPETDAELPLVSP